MPRPEPHLLDAARYRHRTVVTTRYADLDPNDHINNVAMAALIEDARVRFSVAMGFQADRAPGGRRFMVAAVAINYLAQAHFPDPIECLAAPIAIGRTSWTLHQLLLQNGQAVAAASTVMVSIMDGSPAPLGKEMVAVLTPLLLA
jgi:acyl-CoA thioester hydrolase